MTCVLAQIPIMESNNTKNENGDKIKRLMGQTPSFFKSKFKLMLDSSNDLLSGISNRFDRSLNPSQPSESSPDDELARNNYSDFDDDYDDSIDERIIDFESRRVKERRARDEVSSGRYRQPKFIKKQTPSEYPVLNNSRKASSIGWPTNHHPDEDNLSSVTSPLYEVQCGNRFATHTFEVTTVSSRRESMLVEQPIDVDDSKNISTTTSENDIPSKSAASSDTKLSIRSESDISVPSWASSISLDSHSEDAILEFMRKFVTVLFTDTSAITVDIKSEFGNKARTDCGRLWFARLISAQRGKFKKVDESTFYSIIQYFAIVLFECHDSEDFSPAKILMNMCFTFYHEVEVPGCEPYREYLYTYLRDQPIWRSLRYWNAAFFDALQGERLHRPGLRSPNTERTQNTKPPTDAACPQEPNSDLSDAGSSSTYEHKTLENRSTSIHEDYTFYRNISFGQLGTFSCNMHAFGLSRQLCTEFIRKQCVIANLSKDQEEMLRDNVNRMYKETDKWRA